MSLRRLFRALIGRREQSRPFVAAPRAFNFFPSDWTDREAWDRYFSEELSTGRVADHPEFVIKRFVSLAREKGGRIWFPGCGLDLYAYTYAKEGFSVLATDFSPVAVGFQERAAAAFVREKESPDAPGSFTVAVSDFTQERPPGVFDLVVNSRAFQGLSSDAMRSAAAHFHGSLRQGGVAVIDTMNVQGDRRTLIDDSLLEAGFFIAFDETRRWYRRQLAETGIPYVEILDRAHAQKNDQYPVERREEFRLRDQQILDALRAEYEGRLERERPREQARADDPATIMAVVIYATG